MNYILAILLGVAIGAAFTLLWLLWRRPRMQNKGKPLSRRLLSRFIDDLSESIAITDSEGIVLYVNRGFTELTGFSREESLGKHIKFLRSGAHSQSFYEELWATIKRGDIWRRRVVNQNKDGSLREVDAVITPLEQEEEMLAFGFIMHDISDRIRLEKELEQSQKMEALATLAGGVTHDFNNLLHAITGYTDLVRTRTPEGSKEWDYLQSVREASERARELVRQILYFSRDDEPSIIPLEIKPLCRQALRFVQGTLPEAIEAEVDLCDDEPVVDANPTELHQMLMNLCTNAVQAMGEEEGTLSFKLAVVDFSADSFPEEPRALPGPWVSITVADTGYGMDERTRQRIFEPFFTTKPRGKGTGMGLSIVHSVVERASGFIRVDSAPGQGTRFEIYLPHSTERAVAKPADPEAADADAARILLVDDDPYILTMEKEILRHAGYRVSAFQDPQKAMATFRQGPTHFDLLVCDLEMRELDGRTMCKEVRGLRKELPILLVSGSVNLDNDMEQYGDENHISRLEKPASAKEITHAVAQAIAKAS